MKTDITIGATKLTAKEIWALLQVLCPEVNAIPSASEGTHTITFGDFHSPAHVVTLAVNGDKCFAESTPVKKAALLYDEDFPRIYIPDVTWLADYVAEAFSIP